MEVPEVVINMVDYDMVQQMSLASCDFAKEANEFIKAGFYRRARNLGKTTNGKRKQDKTGV